MNDDNLVPLFAIVFIFGAPIAAWIVTRVLAHQERIEMIRRGMMPPADDRWARRNARYAGWQGAPGVPPGMPNMPPPPPVYGAVDPYGWAQRKLRKGITVALVGFAILISLSFVNDGHSGSWMLFGLIPLFVGIAQVINALLNGAVIPTFMGPGAGAGGNFGPRPQSGSASPGTRFTQATPPPPPGPAGWRPGATPGIEEHPAQPPDVR